MSTPSGSGGGGDPASSSYFQSPSASGNALALSSDSINAADLSIGSYSGSSTSGVVSGGESGGEGSGLHQRLVAAGLSAVGGAGVSREQGVRDLRSIIQ